MEYFLIYPHQLFEDVLSLPRDTILVFVEDPLYFTQYSFHKHKLILHRASMKYMEAKCRQSGFQVHYVEYSSLSTSADIFDQLSKPVQISLFDPVDDWLEQALTKGNTTRREVSFLKSPGFYLSREDIGALFPKKNKTYAMSRFYTAMRKQHTILIADGEPVGGRWSLDTENRKKLPKDITVPELPIMYDWDFLDDAKKYVQTNFSDNPGEIDTFFLPTNHNDTLSWFVSFLHTRFIQFGPYEDAIHKDEPFLFHSILSPLINIGLLTPTQVIDQTLKYAEDHTIPLNSVEGFIRQIIGWREYIRAVYVQKGRYMRSQNFLEAHSPLPKGMYDGSTGVEPLDIVVRRLVKHGYTHHIERLMVLGNFLLLNNTSPHEVYKWFMELYVDSYDWVMVPNVYGMSQYAAGNLMTTKPYSSGSAYILRMSNFKKGPWTTIWDGLFWQFIEKHKEYYKSNHRTKMMPKVLRRLSKEKKKELWEAVEAWRKGKYID